MVAFTETATLKIQDKASAQIRKINAEILKLSRNMRNLNRLSGGSGGINAQAASAMRQGFGGGSAMNEAGRNMGGGFLRYMAATGAAIIGSNIAMHLARKMGRAIGDNSRDLNTAETRARIMGADTPAIRDLRARASKLADSLGNIATVPDLMNKALDVASPMGGASLKNNAAIVNMVEVAEKLKAVSQAMGADVSNFSFVSLERIFAETGALYSKSRQNEITDAVYRAIQVSRGSLDFDKVAYLFRMVPNAAALTGEQLKGILIQMGLNSGRGSNSVRYPFEMQRFISEITSLSRPKRKTQAQIAFGIRDSEGQLKDRALAEKGDYIGLQENIVMRLLARVYKIQEKDVDAFIAKRRGSVLSKEELARVQPGINSIFNTNSARNVINTTQFSRTRYKDLAATERLQSLSEAFATTLENADIALGRSANALSDAFTGLWNTAKKGLIPAFELVRKTADRARPYLWQDKKTPPSVGLMAAGGIAAGAMFLPSALTRILGAGAGMAASAALPGQALQIAAVQLQAAAAALTASASAEGVAKAVGSALPAVFKVATLSVGALAIGAGTWAAAMESIAAGTKALGWGAADSWFQWRSPRIKKDYWIKKAAESENAAKAAENPMSRTHSQLMELKAQADTDKFNASAFETAYRMSVEQRLPIDDMMAQLNATMGEGLIVQKQQLDEQKKGNEDKLSGLEIPPSYASQNVGWRGGC